MKIYKNQKEVEALVKDGVFVCNESVTFEFNLRAGFSLKISGDISALDISALNISAGNISARDISTRDISAGNISAWNISAWNISARDISFYSVCFAYVKFVCKSIKGKRKNSKYFCLDSEVIIKGDK